MAEYYAAFNCLGQEFSSEVDVTPFLSTHIEAQLHQVRALDLRENIQRQIWTALEHLTEETNLHPRVANALWDAFFGRTVTAGYYRSLADVSPATATKDLAATVSSGLLMAQGRRRGRRYGATEQLFEAVGGILSIEVTGPPTVARDRITSELSRRVTLMGEALGLTKT